MERFNLLETITQNYYQKDDFDLFEYLSEFLSSEKYLEEKIVE